MRWGRGVVEALLDCLLDSYDPLRLLQSSRALSDLLPSFLSCMIQPVQYCP